MTDPLGHFLWKGEDRYHQLIWVVAIHPDLKWIYYLRLYHSRENELGYSLDYDGPNSTVVRTWKNFPGVTALLDGKKEKEDLTTAKRMLIGYMATHCLGFNRLREISVLKKLIGKLS